MNIEGLWTVQFAKSEEEFGGLQVEEEVNRGGIFVLTDNRLYGGGISYYFVGTYKVAETGIEIIVNATKYNDIVPGPFGPVTEIRLIFRGVIDGDSMTLHGHVEDEPGKKLVIKAERKTAIT
jgi:hypothetical protein